MDRVIQKRLSHQDNVESISFTKSIVYNWMMTQQKNREYIYMFILVS